MAPTKLASKHAARKSEDADGSAPRKTLIKVPKMKKPRKSDSAKDAAKAKKTAAKAPKKSKKTVPPAPASLKAAAIMPAPALPQPKSAAAAIKTPFVSSSDQHSTMSYDGSMQSRPSDTRELLALAAAADRNAALQQLRQQEEMLIRQRMEQEIRMEQELALVAAHQQNHAERQSAAHNLAVNALVNGHTLDDILLRSGLSRDFAVEVAERMLALSNQVLANTNQGPQQRMAAPVSQPDAMTLALLREQAMREQALQEQAMREQHALNFQNALRMRGQFPS